MLSDFSDKVKALNIERNGRTLKLTRQVKNTFTIVKCLYILVNCLQILRL